MITSNSRDQKVVEAKQEAGDAAADEGKFLKAAAASTSRQWSAFRNPRIVSVSKTFGGKDRHSKVCTIRGLRDRRIRLSVPTAIQLYDLQDRLGVGQPSKVIDWLLDASKDDIDKLPPLQLPQMFDHQFRQQQQMLVSNNEYLNQSLQYYSSLDPFPDANYMLIKHGHHHHPHHHVGLPFLGMKTNFSTGLDFHDEDQSACRANSKSCRDDAEKASLLRAKSKEIEQGYHDGVCNYSGNSTSTTGQVSAQPLFPLTSCNSSSSSLPAGNYGILNYNSMPFNSYYHHLDSSNLSLSQFGSSHGFLSHQQADQNPLNNNNDAAVSFPMMPSSFAGSHLFFCPPPTMSPLFPPPFYNPYNCNASAGDRREANNFQLLATSSRPMSSSTRPDDSPGLNPGLVHLRWNKESHDHGKVNNDNS